MKYGILSILGVFLLLSCTQDIMEWSEPTAWLQLAGDDQAYTFAYENSNVVTDTIWITVETVGQLGTIDRSFRVEQIMVENANNARPAVHYLPFDDKGIQEWMQVRAGEVSARWPVILFRDRDVALQDTTFLLKFGIVANEYFECGDTSAITQCISITDKLIKPTLWDRQKQFFGTYSRVKHQFMMDVSGLVLDNSFFNTLKDVTYVIYLKNLFIKELKKYNDEHPDKPLTSEPLPGHPDGEPISFP